jgi:phosphate-selective porin OprO/OprP
VSGIFLAAVILERQRWLAQDAENEAQVGQLDSFDRADVRGLRIGAVGTLNFERPWVYTVFAASRGFERGFDVTTQDGLTFFDYRLDVPLWNRASVSIGKQKEPISMERLISLVHQPMQERTSVSDALLPSRNVGIVLNSTVPNERVSFAVGVFNDWFDAGEAFDESATQVIGRVTGLPFLSGDNGGLVHLGFGVRHSDARQALRFQSRPEFNSAPDFVATGADTELFDADSTIVYNVEASLRRGPIWVAGEYLQTNIRAPAQGNPRFSGYHVTASWIATGEMRPYNTRSGALGPVLVARPVNRGGWGAWEFAVRWSDLDLTDGAIEGGEMGIFSAGFTWWLTSAASLSANYRDITLDRFGTVGRARGFLGRVLLVLQ